MWVGSQGFTLQKSMTCSCLKFNTKYNSNKEKGKINHEDEDSGSESDEEDKENKVNE